MVNEVFNLSVEALVLLAKITGTTYQEINVLIFLILWPLLTLTLLILVLRNSS